MKNRWRSCHDRTGGASDGRGESEEIKGSTGEMERRELKWRTEKECGRELGGWMWRMTAVSEGAEICRDLERKHSIGNAVRRRRTKIDQTTERGRKRGGGDTKVEEKRETRRPKAR